MQNFKSPSQLKVKIEKFEVSQSPILTSLLFITGSLTAGSSTQYESLVWSNLNCKSPYLSCLMPFFLFYVFTFLGTVGCFEQLKKSHNFRKIILVTSSRRNSSKTFHFQKSLTLILPTFLKEITGVVFGELTV